MGEGKRDGVEGQWREGIGRYKVRELKERKS